MTVSSRGVYWLYSGLLHLAGLLLIPWVLLRLLFSANARQSLPARLGRVLVPDDARGGCLFHGVSVGEIIALAPLVRAYLAQGIGPVILSSTTPGGRQTAHRLFPELPVLAFPLDLPLACSAFLRRVQPSSVVLVELEIWPNFLRACQDRTIPVVVVNGRITRRSMTGYRRVLRLLPEFDRIEAWGVQNEKYAERFRALGVAPERITVTGNLKWENLPSDPSSPAEARWRTWVGEQRVVALASTHADEEVQLVSALRDLDALLLVIPRHPERAQGLVHGLRSASGDRPILLLSRISTSPLARGAILLVDGFGELEQVYRCADAVFVGGSLVPHGGQNMFEPAALGKVPVVGPYVENFELEVDLLSAEGGLIQVLDVAGAAQALLHQLADPEENRRAGAAAQAAVSQNRGAVQATMDLMAKSGLIS